MTPERLAEIERNPRDTASIAAIPSLLAEVRRLQSEVTELTEHRDTYRDRARRLGEHAAKLEDEARGLRDRVAELEETLAHDLAEVRRLQSEVAKWRRDGYVRAAEDRIAALEAGLSEACCYIAPDVTLDGVSVHDRLRALTSSPPDTQDR